MEGHPGLFGEEEFGEREPEPDVESESATDEYDTTSAKEAGNKRKSAKRPRETFDNLPILGTRTIEPVERGEGVKIAPMPLLLIYKGIPDASLLAEILFQKYEYHMPFFRQIKQFAHLGMTELKEATMVVWFKRTMELLRPLYDALVREIFQSGYVQSDETTVPIINNEKHQTDKEYLWMARAVMERLSAFFHNDGSRAGDVIKGKTDKYKFRGYLQCGGFPGYASAFRCGVVLVSCLVHIRRYFEHALNENPKAASWFLARIKEIYHIESDCDKGGMDFEQRRAERQLRTKPLMVDMKQWLETEGVKYSSRTLIGTALVTPTG